MFDTIGAAPLGDYGGGSTIYRNEPMPVTPLPTPPSRLDTVNFPVRADDFLGALNPFVAEINSEVLPIAAEAMAAAATSIAAANYKGVYAAGTTYQIGHSCTYNSKIYYAKTVNTGRTPANDAYWQEVVAVPMVTGNSGKALTTDGTSAAWETIAARRISIFSAAAASLPAISSLDNLDNSIEDTGLTAGVIHQVKFGSSVFVAACAASSGNVASSPDGETWTLRTMPATGTWKVYTDGTKFMGVTGSTNAAYSAAGTSWAATAATIPAAGNANAATYHGSTFFIGASSSNTTMYSTTDNGANWNTITTPDRVGGNQLYSVGGLLWMKGAGTAAYTSPTGGTGTFTTRTLPISPYAVWQDFDGALLIQAATATTIYRSTDGINWTALPETYLEPAYLSANLYTINGTKVHFSKTLGSAKTINSIGETIRRSRIGQAPGSGNACGAKNASGTIFVFPEGGTVVGLVGRIAPAAADAALAFFQS